MKLLDALTLYLAHKTAKTASEIKRSLRFQTHAKAVRHVPYKQTIHVTIPLDDDMGTTLPELDIDVPPGVSIDHIEIEAAVLDGGDEAAPKAEAAGIVLPPAPGDACLLTDVTAMTRAERRRFEREEARRMKRRLLEVDRLLKQHTPQEVERILWENR